MPDQSPPGDPGPAITKTVADLMAEADAAIVAADKRRAMLPDLLRRHAQDLGADIDAHGNVNVTLGQPVRLDTIQLANDLAFASVEISRLQAMATGVGMVVANLRATDSPGGQS